MTVGCVILASGRSSRFGSDKLMAQFGGKPLAEHAMRQAAGLFCPVAVVTRSDAVARLVEPYRGAGVTAVVHALPNRADTIRLGIEAMPAADGCCFLVADQPLLTRGTLTRMREAFLECPSAIVRASFQGRAGNPVIFPKALFAELAALPDGANGREVIARNAGRVKRIEVEFPAELSDIDTPEKLAELAREALKYGNVWENQ